MTIVVVAVNMTPTEMIAGMVVMLITLVKDALVLSLAHALVVATSLQVALKVDHTVPAVDVLKAQATTAAAVKMMPTIPTTCMK